MISAIVLNSDNREISKTLSSLSWCDEVLVWTEPLNGNFAAARNKALEKVKGDWVLFVDSDEIVSGELALEIKNKIKVVGNEIKDKKIEEGKTEAGYFLRRTDWFWGRELKYGETSNVRLLRLAKRRAGKWERKVHEFWDIKGITGVLKNPLYHFPHPTISEFIKTINFYTDTDANELTREGKDFRYYRVIINPLGKFLQNYILRFGFLDGLAGLTVAFMMSFQSLVVRIKQFDKLTARQFDKLTARQFDKKEFS